MATYAIGDIHGRADLLKRLLDRFEPAATDQVVFLGDYIDRGPDSRGVVDTLLAYQDSVAANVSFLQGNHEQWMLRTMQDSSRHSWLLGMGGLSTIHSYSPEVAESMAAAIEAAGPAILLEKPELPYEAFFSTMPREHVAFYRNLRLFVRTDDAVCVHAGVSENYERVEDETEASLLWGYADWWMDYTGPDTIVYGHWGNAGRDQGMPEPFIHGRTVGIDCVASGQLMAMRFPDGAIWSVR